MAVDTPARAGVAGALWGRLRDARLSRGAPHEIAALDGLRALAILLVLWHHVYRWGPRDWPLLSTPIVAHTLDFGFVGVLLFFVLSGFLLFLPYARALMTSAPWPSTRHFYRRRMLRILPVYYAALAIVGLLLAGAGHLQGWVVSGLVFSFLLFQNVSQSASNLVGVVDGALWTLAIEWQFYLVLPWIAMAVAVVAGHGRRRRVLLRVGLALAGLIVFGLAARGIAAFVFYRVELQHPTHTQALLLLMLHLCSGSYLEDFALGMLLSVFYVLVVEQRQRLPRWLSPPDGMAAAIAIPGLIGCYCWAAQMDVFRAENDWGFIPSAGWSWIVLGVWATTLCFALLVLGVLTGPRLLRRVFAWAPLRFIGIISYSMYVWHLPIINLVRNTGAALLLILLRTIASYSVIERPFLKRRYTVSPKVRAALRPA
jgi:peptidoglycan/LPS O-acetylase OafA/YrhL